MKTSDNIKTYRKSPKLRRAIPSAQPPRLFDNTLPVELERNEKQTAEGSCGRRDGRKEKLPAIKLLDKIGRCFLSRE